MAKNNATPRSFAVDSQATGKPASVPAEALIFDAGPFALAKSNETKDGKTPIQMRARSGQPIEHWYWGKIVHDMAGFKPAGPTIPIDYCHNFDEVMGYLDSFKASNEGLDVSGQLVSFAEKDRCEEVILKSRAGVPYQSSIYFSDQDMVLEQVGPNVQVQVNGFMLQGPGLVVRQWTLRGVAVCPYGYDPGTSTKLSAGERGDVTVHFQTPPEDHAAMSQTPVTPNSPAPTDTPTQLAAGDKPAEKPASPPADPRAEFKATLAKFTEKFGATNGAAWAAEGLSYEEALDKHAATLATQLTAEQGKNAELATKLAAAPRGEAEPVSFTAPDKHPGSKGGETPAKFAHMGGLGKFAASINLPGKK